MGIRKRRALCCNNDPIQEKPGTGMRIDVDPKKVGKDAWEIFGFDKANVIVSDDIDEVLARSRRSANLSPNIGIVDNILKGKCQCKKYKLCMLTYQIQNYP